MAIARKLNTIAIEAFAKSKISFPFAHVVLRDILAVY